MNIALGDNDRAEGLDAIAQQIYQRYEAKILPGADNTNRLYIPPVRITRQEMLKELLLPGTLPPEAAAVLETQMGITNLPAITNAPANSTTNSMTAPPAGK